MSNGGRRAELDGVRGIAILLVLVGHATYWLAPLAAAGVALFFTLSGYLITGLLLAERERHGRLNLPRFYARRFARLAPPLFVMLAVMGVLLGPTWREWLAPALWVSNYTDTAVYFEHTWSLAVEEQFYLVWPVALLFLLRRRSPARALRWVTVALAAWWLLLVLSGHQDYAYAALETAGVPILGGCLVALGGVTVRFRAGEALVALLVLASTLSFVDGQGSWSAVPMVVTPLTVALVAAAKNARWLRWRPLGFCGVASYSLYLWHFPVAWVVGGGAITPVGVVVGVLVGLVAYLVIEAPVMRWRESRKAPLSAVDAAKTPEPALA